MHLATVWSPFRNIISTAGKWMGFLASGFQCFCHIIEPLIKSPFLSTQTHVPVLFNALVGTHLQESNWWLSDLRRIHIWSGRVPPGAPGAWLRAACALGLRVGRLLSSSSVNSHLAARFLLATHSGPRRCSLHRPTRLGGLCRLTFHPRAQTAAALPCRAQGR